MFDIDTFYAVINAITPQSRLGEAAFVAVFAAVSLLKGFVDAWAGYPEDINERRAYGFTWGMMGVGMSVVAFLLMMEAAFQ